MSDLRDKQTDRQTDSHTNRETDRQKYGQTDRQMDRQTDGHTDGERRGGRESYSLFAAIYTLYCPVCVNGVCELYCVLCIYLINPPHACAARVSELSLCVCSL